MAGIDLVAVVGGESPARPRTSAARVFGGAEDEGGWRREGLSLYGLSEVPGWEEDELMSWARMRCWASSTSGSLAVEACAKGGRASTDGGKANEGIRLVSCHADVAPMSESSMLGGEGAPLDEEEAAEDPAERCDEVEAENEGGESDDPGWRNASQSTGGSCCR